VLRSERDTDSSHFHERVFLFFLLNLSEDFIIIIDAKGFEEE